MSNLYDEIEKIINDSNSDIDTTETQNYVDPILKEVDGIITTGICPKITDLFSHTNNVVEKTDVRLYDFYEGYFTTVKKDSEKLSEDGTALLSFNAWLNANIKAAEEVTPPDGEDPPLYDGGDYGSNKDDDDDDVTPINKEEVNSAVEGAVGGAGGAVEALEKEEVEDVEGEHLYIDAPVEALEKYTIRRADWEQLSDKDKEAIEEKLKDVGYSDEYIDDLKDGKASLSKVVMSKVANALEEALRKDPDLREKLIDKYGFDIFYEDGTINPTKLACALLVDAGNSSDGYDLISMLANDYGIDLVGMGDLSYLANQILSSLQTNPDLRQQLIDKYGFDIFNNDGTINNDRLRYALMIDDFEDLDNFDMIGTLYNGYGINIDAVSSIDNLALKLMEAAETNPAMRQQLLDRYGVDIFDDDGTVNLRRLRLALMEDAFDEDNTFDFINILYNSPEAGNITTEEMDALTLRLLSGLELQPEMRQELIDRYGFDIFNTDGTVNADRLKYAMLVDKFDAEDDLDLTAYLTELIGDVDVNNGSVKKKGNALPIIAGIGLAAASAGAGYSIYKKRKEEEEEEEEEFSSEDEEGNDL